MKTPIAGYPTVVGNKRMSVLLHSGPDPYVQVDGDTVEAREFGLKILDFVFVMGSSDENVVPIAFMSNTQRPPGFGGMTSVLIRYYEPGGAQIANGLDLSDAIVRLCAIGE